MNAGAATSAAPADHLLDRPELDRVRAGSPAAASAVAGSHGTLVTMRCSSLLVAAIVASVPVSARASDCVTLAKGAGVYDSPSVEGRRGVALRAVPVFVTAREPDGWLAAYAIMLRPAGGRELAMEASIRFFVRARDARRSACPRSSTVVLMKDGDTDDTLRWPDRRDAGSSDPGRVRPAPRAKIETTSGELPMRCFDTESFAGLRVHVCVQRGKYTLPLSP